MAALTPEELWKLWKQELLSSEMAIGQLIQNQVKQQIELEAHGRALFTLQTQVERLLTQPELPSPPKSKKAAPKHA